MKINFKSQGINMTNNVAGKKRTKKPFDPTRDNIATPLWVIDLMIEWAEYKPQQRVLDPCCGDGRILKRIST